MITTEESDFDSYVRGSGPRLKRLAFLLTGDLDTAEDLLQSAYAKVLPRWGRVRRYEDPDAEPFVLAGCDAFDAAGLDRDGLAEASDDARVGVPRTERHGRVEGTVGEIPHWGRA